MKNQEFRIYPDDRYIGLTGEAAPKLPSVLIGFTGPSPSQVAEVAEPITRIPTEVVDEADLPDEWREAFRAVGFEFEDEEEEYDYEDEPVLTGIDLEIENMRKQIELKTLTLQLAAVGTDCNGHLGRPHAELWRSGFNLLGFGVVTLVVFFVAGMLLS